MWRPVALSAFLALLFMASRSGQPPVQPDAEDSAKGDLGAKSESSGINPSTIKIDLVRSSAHPKPAKAAEHVEDIAKPGQDESPEADPTAPIRVAALSVDGAQTIPLPAPKTGDTTAGMRVIVTQGEEKTALTSGEDEALSLMPPGPDFAATVQKELARLGCYRGRVDNIWGPMSRNAVARFNRMAKAKLPLKQPTRALLSSARKVPDGYCNGNTVAGDGAEKIASLEPGAGVEALKNRPSYLPPWMRGEPMPAPDENRVTEQAEPEAKPDKPAIRTASREEPRTTRASASRAERRARRARAQRRAQRRRTRSFSSVMDGRGAFWPGQ
jgi:hypothetical protein